MKDIFILPGAEIKRNLSEAYFYKQTPNRKKFAKDLCTGETEGYQMPTMEQADNLFGSATLFQILEDGAGCDWKNQELDRPVRPPH